VKIKKDWWKDLFNEIYLVTDARSVCNAKLTSLETDILEEVLKLRKDDKIVDLCGGQGRHSLELARRGYNNLTVLDFSDYLVRLGRKAAEDAGFNIKFVRRDARFSGLKGNNYSAVFIMANSFGYFQDQKENLRVLKESHRLLKKGGRLLLDLSDPTYLKKNLKPLTWHEANKDIIVCRKRELKGEVIKAREVVLSKKKGLLRDGSYCERIYDKEKITRLLKRAGFKNLSVKSSVSLHKKKKDYGLLTSRMIVMAVRP